MKEIVAAALPITRREVTKDDAIKFFTGLGHEEKAKLLSYRSGDRVKLYTCGAVTDYFFGYMAPNTRFFEIFSAPAL